jgi:GrpB-like predicted nucleotidyltransferase (UPF0157 family)
MSEAMPPDGPLDAPPPPELLPHDRDWRRRFEDEKGRLLARLGGKLVVVEHVGATAVVGLAARPIIDVLVAIRSLEDVPSLMPTLAAMGYRAATVHGDDGLQALERENPIGHYRLLLCTRTMKSYARILLLREWLRAHPFGLLQYERLRQDKIAAGDEAYSQAKAEFVASVIDPLLAAAG